MVFGRHSRANVNTLAENLEAIAEENGKNHFRSHTASDSRVGSVYQKSRSRVEDGEANRVADGIAAVLSSLCF